jgi:molybdopterin-guanine dinucleotide biosynthesis protein A
MPGIVDSDAPCHGLVLTGGASSRMGVAKASIQLHGVSLGRRVADAMRTVADPVLAVGPAFDTGLGAVDDPRQGPLVAFVAGADALADRGHAGPIVLAACDLAFVDEAGVRLVVESLGSHDGVIPVVAGRDQPALSCYTPHAVAEARRLVARGARSLHEWVAAMDVCRISADERLLMDVDTPADLERARRIAGHVPTG